MDSLFYMVGMAVVLLLFVCRHFFFKNPKISISEVELKVVNFVGLVLALLALVFLIMELMQ